MSKERGKVYIASMNLRGKWYPLPENFERINVTSAQAKNSIFRKTFSPMTPITDGYKGYYCFENYWQSGKRYEDMDKSEINKLIKWWKDVKKAHRRYPYSKKNKVIYAKFDEIEEKLDYISSRKKVYVPEYYELIKNNNVLDKLKENIKNGINYVVYDFDGPRTKDGEPSIMEINKNNLKEKINDTSYPFGHGYIVAGSLLGIIPKDYL